VGDRTKGYVGADLESLCREAGLNAFRENPNLEFVEARHFRAALKSVKPSVDPSLAKTYEAMGAEMRKWRVSFGDMPLYQ
jgi:transitional endoplasmic reticulum ATPase